MPSPVPAALIAAMTPLVVVTAIAVLMMFFGRPGVESAVRQPDGTYRQKLQMRAPSRWERALYRARGVPPPLAATPLWPGAYLPESWRRAHHRYADAAGLYWLPCPLCGRMFGGHELGGRIPDDDDPSLGHSICTACTRDRHRRGEST